MSARRQAAGPQHEFPDDSGLPNQLVRFRGHEHAANPSGLKELGNICTRIVNPTQDALGQRMAAYLRLTQKMDTDDVSRGRGDHYDALSRIGQPAPVAGIDTDVLHPLAEQREQRLPRARPAVLEGRTGTARS